MQVEMTIKGLMMDPVTHTPIVVLQERDADRMLPIWVGVVEANAIALQVENITTARPMTHDLLRNIIEDLDGTVDRIVVSDLKEQTFYAVIHIRIHGEHLAIDARPSDAIALALRARAPIMVEDTVFDRARQTDYTIEQRDPDQLKAYLDQMAPESMGKYKM